jgi:hypothetical protein
LFAKATDGVSALTNKVNASFAADPVEAFADDIFMGFMLASLSSVVEKALGRVFAKGVNNPASTRRLAR